ncbi:MAG: phosphate regulon sensor protein PhoR, partial [Rhizobacter sp.]
MIRLIAVAVAVAAGGFVGHLAGHALGYPELGAVIGAGVGACLVVLADTVRSHRLIRWLSGRQETEAPRDTGLWGEIGYRVEKAIRLREKSMELEQTRLAQFISAMEASPNGVLLLDEA